VLPEERQRPEPVRQGAEKDPDERARDHGRRNDQHLRSRPRRSSIQGQNGEIRKKDGKTDALGKDEGDGKSLADPEARDDEGDDRVDERVQDDSRCEAPGRELLVFFPDEGFGHSGSEGDVDQVITVS
jgi:hypothetical protein